MEDRLLYNVPVSDEKKVIQGEMLVSLSPAYPGEIL